MAASHLNLALGGTLMQSAAGHMIGGSIATLASATLFSFIASTAEEDADTLLTGSATVNANT